MSETTDLFGADDVASEPSFQRQASTHHQTPQTQATTTSFFQSESFFEEQIDKLVQIKNRMHQLYEELGDGKITDSLTPSRRNEIIEDLQQERGKLKTILDETYDPIDKDIRRASSLQLIVTTSTDGFDRLLNRDTSNTDLSADEIQFQRHE